MHVCDDDFIPNIPSISFDKFIDGVCCNSYGGAFQIQRFALWTTDWLYRLGQDPQSDGMAWHLPNVRFRPYDFREENLKTPKIQ